MYVLTRVVQKFKCNLRVLMLHQMLVVLIAMASEVEVEVSVETEKYSYMYHNVQWDLKVHVSIMPFCAAVFVC